LWVCKNLRALKKTLFTLLFLCLAVSAVEARVRVGAERMELYVPLLEGKRVGVVTNHTGVVAGRHLVDTLLARGVTIEVVFAPEHGFRGNVGAGDHLGDEKDPATGLDIVSLYGARRKPSAADIARCEVVVFDIQDVGLRYYTYLSTLHYVMEACAEGGVPLVVLDRPNPNGMYVDGPVLNTARHRSFVGMHPIPVVHGMTFGELAGMINGKGWLAGGVQCRLVVVPCEGYTHSTRYELPVRPSPNLPNQRSVYLYPSLCYFEATAVSVGRGTDFPFQMYGHPAMTGSFAFTPQPNEGAPNPPQKGVVCHGRDLRENPDNETIIARGIDLSYLVDAHRQLGGEKFLSPFFEKLIGVDWVRGMIVEGHSAEAIEARWQGDVEQFKQQRKPYLLYEEN
jgi:uncharacterized protein YbbC (DUF1343 family)